MKKIEILDVAVQKHLYSDTLRYTLIIDREPQFKYQICNAMLLAHDSGFFSCYVCQDRSPQKAFGGAIFDIPLINGKHITARGEWWLCPPPAVSDDELIEVCVGTLQSIHKGQFFPTIIRKSFIDTWMKTHTPKCSAKEFVPMNMAA